MNRTFRELDGRRFDLLIVGGGIFGACAAWDATLRGLAVALVEQADFGSGASANSFKIVHGGIRYLQHADVVRLRASCHERSALLRIAPHLVTPLPIAIPTYGHGRKGKAVLAAGMWLYDALTIDRNRGIADPARHIPWSGLLAAREVRALFPGIEERGLSGAAVFCDGQMYNPPRLVLAFLRSAAARGAVIVNYAEAEGLLRSGDEVEGARVRDRVGGDSIEVRARAVLNAGGGWVPWFARREGMPLANAGAFSRDAYFVVPRRFPHGYGVALQGRTRDPDAIFARAARHLFLVPWRGYTLCGVWHRVWKEPPESVHVAQQEIAAFVDELNEAMPGLELDVDEACLWNAGLVPFGDNEEGAEDLRYGKRSHLIDHAHDGGARNLVSLIGVRYTMARGDAADAVDLVCAKLGERRARPATERIPLAGAQFGSFNTLVDAVQADARASTTPAPSPLSREAAEALAHNYGSDYRSVLDLGARKLGSLACIDRSTTLRAEITHAIRDEMAVRLSDIVFRRTDLASGGHPGRAALEDAASLAAAELGWSAAKRNAELAEVERRLELGAPIEEAARSVRGAG
jgi:glycerol-3-phosphate dehydrogenase